MKLIVVFPEVPKEALLTSGMHHELAEWRRLVLEKCAKDLNPDAEVGIIEANVDEAAVDSDAANMAAEEAMMSITHD